MKVSVSILALAGVFLVPGGIAQKMQKAEEPEEVGLVSIDDTELPLPDEMTWIPLSEGALSFSRFEEVTDSDSPGGPSHWLAGKGPAILALTAPAQGARTYLLSMWVKSSETFSGRVSFVSDEVYYGKHTPLVIPATKGEWKCVSSLFRTAPGSTELSVNLRVPPGGAELSLTGVKIREASETEFSKAYANWRSQYPERDLSYQKGFGLNLESFRRKLREPVVPDKPLLVMGIGSSYTNMLGNGERLVQWIREHYPDAPPVHYKKHVGSAVNYAFTRGWMRQHVLEQQPDLVILYSGGEPEDLEKLLADFRSHSSADVIVASLHLRERDNEISDKTINDPVWDEIRAVAEKYDCEWVDSRREWAAYLQEHDKPLEWLLRDAVHQSDHGALVINENIVRHITEPPGNEKGPVAPEKLVTYVEGTGGQGLVVEGEFEKGAGIPGFAGHSVILPRNEKSVAKLNFTGNRVDFVGRTNPDGGRIAFELDGKPLGEFPAYFTTLIRPGGKNHKPARGSAADRSPHMVRLGSLEKVVPQVWKIQMTSDNGDYELIGGVTGPDGKGNNGSDFISDSGQIIVPGDLWRRRLESDGTHSNKTGDTFSWRVVKATKGEVRIPEGNGELFSVSIADQIPYGKHVLEAKCIEGDEVEIAGFIVHEPAVLPESGSAP